VLDLSVPMAAGLTAFIMSRKGADAALSRMNAAKGQVVRHVEDRSQREESLSGDDHHGDAMG